MPTVHDLEGVARIFYEPVSRVMLTTWVNLMHAHIKPLIERQMEQVARGARFLVVDVRLTRSVPSPEDQAWYASTAVPFYKANGLRALVNLVPQSAVAKLGASRWRATAAQGGIDTWEAGDLESALRLLHERYGVDVTPAQLEP